MELTEQKESVNKRNYPIWSEERIYTEKKRRVWGTWGEITKDLTFTQLKTQKKRRKQTELKKIDGEKMAENCLKLAEDINLDSRRWSNSKQDKPKEIHVPAHHNPTLGIKTKNSLEKATGKEMTDYLQGATIWTRTDFSPETREATKKQHIFQMQKGKYCQTRILYQVKISFRNEGETKISSD